MGERWLDPSEWSGALCAELHPVLAFLEARFGARIAKVHLDMKSSIVDVYLEGEMPSGAIAVLETEFGGNEHLRFWPGGSVSCQRDFTAINWSVVAIAPPPPAKPWWKIW